MAGWQISFITLRAALNTCTLCMAAPSGFSIATLLPWTLSPAVFNYFGNLFTFGNFFILAGALASSAWAQQFLERHTFCLHVYCGHPLDSLHSHLVWDGAPKLYLATHNGPSLESGYTRRAVRPKPSSAS